MAINLGLACINAALAYFNSQRVEQSPTIVPESRERLVCSVCGNRDVDMVVTGTERRQLP
jgi:hypothetical protein